MGSIISYPSVFSFGNLSGKKIIVAGLNPSTVEYKEKYLTDNLDINKRYLKQLNYFQNIYYKRYFKKIESFFEGEIRKLLEWKRNPWEKVGFLDLVKCPTKYKKGQWSNFKYNNKKLAKLVINNCKRYLFRQIEMYKPKILIPYGKDVCDWFAKTYNISYKKFDVKKININNNNIYMLFLYQTRAQAHSQEDIIKTQNKLRLILNKLDF